MDQPAFVTRQNARQLRENVGRAAVIKVKVRQSLSQGCG
jgi:hypothetical protein